MLKWLRGGDASPRVAVIEAIQVDRKRRVILVRRDNVEHLVMVGGPTDLLIECNIMRRPMRKPARPPAPESPELRTPVHHQAEPQHTREAAQHVSPKVLLR